MGEIAHRIIGQFVKLRRRNGEGRVVAEDQRGPVGRLVGDKIRGHRAARTGAVVDHGLLAIDAVEILREQTGDQIARPARGEGDDDAHRLVGPLAWFGVSRRDHQDSRGGKGEEMFHDLGPCCWFLVEVEKGYDCAACAF